MRSVDLVKAQGMSGVATSKASRLCVELDGQDGAVLNRLQEAN